MRWWKLLLSHRWSSDSSIVSNTKRDGNQKLVFETLILREMCFAYDPFKNVSNNVFSFLDLWISTFWLHKTLTNTFWLQTNYFKTVTSDFLQGSSFIWHLQFLAVQTHPKSYYFPLRKGNFRMILLPKKKTSLFDGRLLLHTSYLKSYR